MPNVANVLIVGGGIAGMTLGIGIGLARAGIRAEIAEKNPEWNAAGVGLSLQGPALRALRAIGLLDQCVEAGFGYSHYKVCDAAGNVTGMVELPSLNGPGYPATVGIRRQSLHSILMRAVVAMKMPVRLGNGVASLRQDDDGVLVRFDDGAEVEYDLVVGCDGTNSIVRDLIFGAHCQPTYTGQAVWRATVNRPHQVQARFAYNGPRNKVGFNPVSDEQMYIYLHQNLPTFTRPSVDRLPGLLHDQLKDFGGLLAVARNEITAPDQILYRAVTSHILSSPWHRGRVVIIGDAAHTSTPHMASGVALAIEDSVVLAEVLRSNLPLRDALEEFTARRYERCRMVVESALQLGEWEKLPGASDADHVELLDRSFRALAEPI